MAEAAVFQLLSTFAPFLREEANMCFSVRDEIENIRDEFERMSAFLRIADAVEERDPELKVWVKQVRQAAYDTKDALDMYMLQLGHRHGDGFCGFLRKVSCFIKTIITRHQIASEVKRIKSKVINISHGQQRYSDIYGRLEHGSRATTSDSAWYDCRSDALLLQEADLVGIEKPKSQLIQWLVDEDPRLRVISVAGMGGLGKTTLTKKVYDDATVKSHFENHAWITVSESFKIEVLLKDLIRQLFQEVKQPLPQGMDNMDTNSLKRITNAFLLQKRYVLVLDDVWHIHAWQSLRIVFPECNCGSRVILTTRNADLASLSSKEYHGNVYNLEPLPPKESWTLFCNKTFQGNSCPLYLEELSKDILKRCEGLPLAIVAISGVLLSTKEKSMDEWQMIYSNLGAEIEGNDKLKSLNKILSLSYFDLPYYLKLCFLYLSIFPEDFFVHHGRLVRLWVAEGFVEVEEGMSMSKEEVAEGYLNELINRNLIQVAELRRDGRFQSYRIHDLWREMILVKSRKQNLVSIASERGRSWSEKVRRLSIHHNLEDLEESNCFTRLRSLLVFSAIDSLSILSKVASLGDGVRLLTVLDLKGTMLETFPNEIVKLLQLTYLSLRGTKVRTIPKSIGNLKKLETLDLKGTYVTELPDEIRNLKRLCRLLAYRYEQTATYYSFHAETGFKAPVGIGSLSSLEKLCAIDANHGSNSGVVLKEVGKLTQLRRLHILRLQKEDGTVLCSSIEKLTRLRSLVVNAADADEIIDLDSLSLPPQLLQILHLFGLLEKLPHWVPSLDSLTKISLRWSKLKSRDEDSLQLLQRLPNLVYLSLNNAYEGDGLCIKTGGFQRLKNLLLISLTGLKWVRVEAGSMPNLEELYLVDNKLMTELPSGVEHLTNIKYLDLRDMSDGLISNLRRDLQGGDYWKIAHIPKVIIGNSMSGVFRGRYL